jgi:5-methylcytosine-specific restriction protein A
MNALPRQCAVPGCSGKTLEDSRCRRHARVWVGGQPSSSYAGWARLRARVLAEEPRCACGAPSTEVDHVVALAFGGSHARTNLRGICSSCHRRKTAEDSRRGKARKKSEGLFSPQPPGEPPPGRHARPQFTREKWRGG